ncbi:prepilin-type N-terminal cleavage/methylation domain-containing protein [bacterium]|nr:prepilin-type N-terminal cleavage/methylation domain-containing protein [bacterium]
MKRYLGSRRGFTLIELLIVVAIIAILAAIAVPNFLEAQTRAKTSRVKADIRTLATAIESYGVDHNAYPPHKTGAGGEIAYPDRYVPLTTPVAYITSIPSRDPFYQGDILGQGGSEQWVSWTNFKSFPDTHALAPAKDTHRWMLRSRGPDGENEANGVRNDFMTVGLSAAPSMIYDPTNGTISRGDIVRTAIVVP